MKTKNDANGMRLDQRSWLPYLAVLLLIGAFFASCEGVGTGGIIKHNPNSVSSFKVIASTDTLIEIQYEFGRPTISRSGNDDYASVTLADLPRIKRTGSPVLPVMPVRILIPFGKQAVQLKVIPGRRIELDGRYTVEPAQRPVPLSYNGPIAATRPDPSVYDSSNPFPGVLSSEAATQSKRDFRVLLFSIFPVEYLPGEGKLCYYETLHVKVQLGPVADPFTGSRKAFSRDAKQYLKKIVDNPEVIKSYPQGVSQETSAMGSGLLDSKDSYQYVVITNQALSDSAFTDLVASKQARGITATIVTTEWIYANYDGTRPDGGEDDQTRIRNFVIDAYQTWGTEYVLLGGYSGIVPPRLFWVESSPGGGYTAQMPADMYFGCLDGTFDEDADGLYAEPTDGPGGGDVDLYYDVYVGRAAVENAAEASNFVTKTLAYEDSSDVYLHLAGMVGEHLGFGGDSEYAKNSMEEIRLGTDAHGYTTVGFENSLFADFFTTHHAEVAGCSQIPPPLYDEDGSWPISQLIGFINNGNCGFPGVQILNHLGHANYTYCMKMYTSDLASLTNDHFFFAYSQGCMPGGFDTTDCFAEEITSMEHGAFAVIMNARYGWGEYNSTDGPSQRYDRPFWHAILDQGLYELAKANAFSKEHFNITRIGDECMRWCYYETNLFGDPELRIKMVGGVGYQSHVIDDDDLEESSGDGDGLVEPGETIEMPVTLVSSSDGPAHNVSAVLSTTDTYVTITDDTETFGDILPGESGTCADDFGFQVDPACPGGHVVALQLDITADEGSWTSTYMVEVHKDPDINVTPQALEATVAQGGSTSRTLTIENVGIGALDFRIVAMQSPPGTGGATTGSGGPDGFGYVWKDSDEPDGPTFDWVEISGIGTEVTLGDDQSLEVALPFIFPFYGVDKTSVRISSNGYLTFGSDGSTYNNAPIPDVASPNDILAPFWDDLNPSSGAQGHIYYHHDASNSRFIVEYQAVEHYSSGNPETFEIILHADGAIVYQYQTVSLASSCTVGIENSDGSDGLGITYNAAYLHNDLAVRISSGVDWLSFVPEMDVVAPGDFMDVTVTFDAAELTDGTYGADIIVRSNDPDEPQVIVPAALVVGTGVTHTITATAGENGSVDPSGDVPVNHGEDIVFNIIPGTGYEVDDVLVDGSSVGPVTSYTFLNVTADHTLHAEFYQDINYPPVASAGPDQTVDEGDLVTLDGSGSSDPDGDTITYSWIQTTGPGVVLSDPNGAQPTFTAPDVDTPTGLAFQLTVSDGQLSDTDEVSVTVQSVNHAPVADAGGDQTVDEGDTVVLDGSGSSDPDGDALIYSWTQTAGPGVVLSDPNGAQPTFTAPDVDTPTGLAFQLTVSDGQLSDTDEVSVTVQPVNHAPVADAGGDQTVDEGDTVVLDGSGSSDPDGDLLTYSWIQTAGPGVVLSDPNGAQPSFTAPDVDTPTGLAFALTVSDGQLSESDEVAVTVNDSSTGEAAYDATLRAPACHGAGSSCDSGALLTGRDGIGPEPNAPNTLYDTCPDGTSGSYHYDESIDRIRIFTGDGSDFAPGKTVTVEVTVWAWSSGSSDHLDLYTTADAQANPPVWTSIGTLEPGGGGQRVISTTYTLPAGGALQAVRANFRYVGSASSCSTGSYDDHDDLVFAVEPTQGAAEYDSTLMAPACHEAGSMCDSGALLDGRDGIGPEPNAPNTLYDTCPDGTSGSYHYDESIDRIRVFTGDGSDFAPGKTVTVEVTVWAWSSGSSDHLDLYTTTDAQANPPVWTSIGTLEPGGGGQRVITASYTLPAGGALQAVRANFRYNGSASSCSTGTYDDHDDLAFAVAD